MDFGDRSLKFSLTLDLEDRSLKSGLGPWISGIDPWNLPLPWIWGNVPWNQAWGHGFRGSILEIYPYPGFGERSLKSGLGPWISGIDPWNLSLPRIWGNDPWNQAWDHGFWGSILEIFPYPGFGGSILEIRLGAMDFGDRSLKFSLTLDLGERSLKLGLGPWISGIDPWNFPLPWIWGNDPWNQAWGHGFRGSILEIYPYPGFGGSILEIKLGAMDFGDPSLKFTLTLDLGDRSLKSGLGPWISGIDPWNLPLPWILGNVPWNQAWGHGFRGSILEIYPYPGFGGTILEIRLGAMDFGDRSLKFTLTLDLGEGSLKLSLGPWISGIDPWNLPLPWIWGNDPWNQAWGHGFRGSILEIYPYPGFGGSILEIRLGAMDLVDRSLKFTLTLDLGDRSLKLGLGQWIWGIDPWNLPLPWIWGIDP